MGAGRARFTLIEMVVALAIAAVLLALALPLLQTQISRVKRSEMILNLVSIMDAEKAFYVAYDGWLVLPRHPDTVGKDPQPWTYDATWSQLGWEPDGDTRGQYELWLGDYLGDNWCPDVKGAYNEVFELYGRSDVDGDGHTPIYVHYPGQWALASKTGKQNFPTRSPEYCMCEVLPLGHDDETNNF